MVDDSRSTHARFHHTREMDPQLPSSITRASIYSCFTAISKSWLGCHDGTKRLSLSPLGNSIQMRWQHEPRIPNGASPVLPSPPLAFVADRKLADNYVSFSISAGVEMASCQRVCVSTRKSRLLEPRLKLIWQMGIAIFRYGVSSLLLRRMVIHWKIVGADILSINNHTCRIGPSYHSASSSHDDHCLGDTPFFRSRQSLLSLLFVTGWRVVRFQ